MGTCGGTPSCEGPGSRTDRTPWTTAPPPRAARRRVGARGRAPARRGCAWTWRSPPAEPDQTGDAERVGRARGRVPPAVVPGEPTTPAAVQRPPGAHLESESRARVPLDRLARVERLAGKRLAGRQQRPKRKRP